MLQIRYETGMPLDHKPPSVVAESGQRHPRNVTAGNKKQITVLCYSSAAGRCIPPLIILKRKALNSALVEGELPGTMYGLSSLDGELFQNWFEHHFLADAPTVRPLLLLLDGHSSHYHPGTLELAAKHEVVLFCLPPNTTHLLQPLDKGVFGPLKTYWGQECQAFMSCFNKLMTISNIASSFKTTGIFPFNPSALSAFDEKKGLQQIVNSHLFHSLALLGQERCPLCVIPLGLMMIHQVMRMTKVGF